MENISKLCFSGFGGQMAFLSAKTDVINLIYLGNFNKMICFIFLTKTDAVS